MSNVQGPFQGDQELLVHTGDASLYFAHRNRQGQRCSYKWSYLKQVFRDRLRQCPTCQHSYELFPGLVLEDESGNLWSVQLQAVIVPAIKPEEEDESVRFGGHENEVPEVRGNREPLPKRSGSVQRFDRRP